MPAAVPIMVGLMAYQTYSQVRAGQQAKKIGDFNAAVYERQAEDALVRGREDEQKFRQGVRALIGGQKAGFAGQGVDVTQGSALDVQADAAFLGELDALTIRTNASREAQGLRDQASVSRQGGSMARNQAYGQAAGTVLTGTSILAQRYGWGGAA